MLYVKAEPYNWPYNGDLTPENTALMVIDMQTDFCGKGGFVDMAGLDISLTAAAIEPIKKLLAEARKVKGLTIIHTREGHRPDLSDLPENKRWRGAQVGSEIGTMAKNGSRILVRGEQTWDIIPELYPIEGEIIIDKAGKGSFYATDLEKILQMKGIKNIILTGITTDVCVHTTLREANDRGYECVVLSDCSGATVLSNHIASLEIIKTHGGVFGTVSDSDSVIVALKEMAAQQR